MPLPLATTPQPRGLSLPLLLPACRVPTPRIAQHEEVGACIKAPPPNPASAPTRSRQHAAGGSLLLLLLLLPPPEGVVLLPLPLPVVLIAVELEHAPPRGA